MNAVRIKRAELEVIPASLGEVPYDTALILREYRHAEYSSLEYPARIRELRRDDVGSGNPAVLRERIYCLEGRRGRQYYADSALLEVRYFLKRAGIEHMRKVARKCLARHVLELGASPSAKFWEAHPEKVFHANAEEAVHDEKRGRREYVPPFDETTPDAHLDKCHAGCPTGNGVVHVEESDEFPLHTAYRIMTMELLSKPFL